MATVGIKGLKWFSNWKQDSNKLVSLSESADC